MVAIGLLAHRRLGGTPADLLTRGALRLEPATYFYTVAQDSQQIGSAISSIDTSAAGFTAREAVHVRALISGDSQSVAATSVAFLSKGLVLDSFSIVVSGKHPIHEVNIALTRSGALLPTLAPVAVMLTREPHVGYTTEVPIYNPVARQVERVTIRIAAESLYRVVDSAVFDSSLHRWKAAHIDSVRSWKIVCPSNGISAWVDARGRIVAASEPGGVSIRRTAYEIATLNPQLLTH